MSKLCGKQKSCVHFVDAMKAFMLLVGWLVGLAWFGLVVILNKLDYRLTLKFL